MPRSRRGGGGGGMFGRKKPASAVPARRPAPAPPATQQQQGGGGIMSGIGSTIAQGMAFGTGSAIAHRAVGAVAGAVGGEGAPQQQHDPSAPLEQSFGQDPQSFGQNPNAMMCRDDKQMFFECLQMNKGDQQSCAFLYDALKECQRNSAHM